MKDGHRHRHRHRQEAAAQESADLPGSFFIQFAIGGGLIVGMDLSAGFVGNCFKKPGQPYGVGGTIGISGALGLIEGGAVGISIGWQPGGVDRAEGGGAGVSLGAAYGVGAKVSLGWSFDGPIPGVAVEAEIGAGPAEGVEAEGEVTAGYTKAWTNQ